MQSYIIIKYRESCKTYSKEIWEVRCFSEFNWYGRN